MGCYGYCVVPASLPIPAGLAGIAGAAVAGRLIDDLAVWVSVLDRPDPSADHVKAHNAVVEAAVNEDITPVPLRFGQWSAEFEVFDGLVREKAAWYRERLEAFRGAMEFGIRVARPDKQVAARVVRVPGAATGLEYMNALRANAAATRGEREAGENVRIVAAELIGELAREERVDEARTPHGVIAISHLVPRTGFEAYRERVQQLRARFPELRFLVSGPWVPYSFAV